MAVEHKGLGYTQNRQILGADQVLSVDPASHAVLIVYTYSILEQGKERWIQG